jgi:hypothetical protein
VCLGCLGFTALSVRLCASLRCLSATLVLLGQAGFRPLRYCVSSASSRHVILLWLALGQWNALQHDLPVPHLQVVHPARLGRRKPRLQSHRRQRLLRDGVR